MISDKKQAIFESTLELIKRHGFHGAPMSLVAKNAGVAAGTIYHYFESKEQLICELYKYNQERVKTIIHSALKDKASLKQQLHAVWTNLFQFYVDEPNVLVFFEQFMNSPFNVDKNPNHLRGQLYNFFSDAIKSGKLKSLKPEIVLVLVIGSISSAAKLHLFGKVSLTKNDTARIVDVLWDGIKK